QEIVFDNMVADLIEGLWRNLAGIEQFVGRVSLVGMYVNPIVIGPHEGELYSLAVRGMEVAPVEAVVEKRAVVVVVPVEEERIHAVIGGGVYLLLHHFRIGLVAVEEDRRRRR